MEFDYLNTIDEVQSKLNDEKIILLYFTASWCGPCQKIKPFVQKLKETYPTIEVYLIDVDKAQELSAQFKIKSMPTFCFFKGATLLTRFSGADESKLELVVSVAVKASAKISTTLQPRLKKSD